MRGKKKKQNRVILHFEKKGTHKWSSLWLSLFALISLCCCQKTSTTAYLCMQLHVYLYVHIATNAINMEKKLHATQ